MTEGITSKYAEVLRGAREQGEREQEFHDDIWSDFTRYCHFYSEWNRKWQDVVRATTKNSYPYLTRPEGLTPLNPHSWVLATGDFLLGWVEHINPDVVYFRDRGSVDDDADILQVPVTYFTDPNSWVLAKDAEFEKLLRDYLDGWRRGLAEETTKAAAAKERRERAEWERLNAIYGKVEK